MLACAVVTGSKLAFPRRQSELLCCAVLCCAVLCCAVLCCATPGGGARTHLDRLDSSHPAAVCSFLTVLPPDTITCPIFAGSISHFPDPWCILVKLLDWRWVAGLLGLFSATARVTPLHLNLHKRLQLHDLHSLALTHPNKVTH